MNTRMKVVAAGAVTGLAAVAFTAGTLFAQTPRPQTTPGAPTHEQMERMMDAMHGEGTSARMHEAMGPDGEGLMDQCVAMMGMMQNMGGMMSGGMGGMMGGQPWPAPRR
jgi:hypothetical protein